ncbi:MAG: hypothetical protein QG588_1272 [Candidatus Poribacteria bacterium]|nr:hypothetical protein [Candidatus Poribacteria bacterium]
MPSLCGTHVYHNYDQVRVNKVIEEMKKLGFTVTGNNPWNVDVHQYSIMLQGQWDPASGDLSVIVTSKSWLVPCSKIWEKIDPILEHAANLSIANMI